MTPREAKLRELAAEWAGADDKYHNPTIQMSEAGRHLLAILGAEAETAAPDCPPTVTVRGEARDVAEFDAPAEPSLKERIHEVFSTGPQEMFPTPSPMSRPLAHDADCRMRRGGKCDCGAAGHNRALRERGKA